MSVRNPISVPINKSIFNVFNKGRLYFRIRLYLELLLTLSALIGTLLLIRATLTVYPTVVRDANNKSYFAESAPYVTSYAEISTMTIDTIRLLFTTKGSKHYLKELYPFVSPHLLATIAQSYTQEDNSLIRSASVQDFFITETGPAVQAVMYLTLLQSNNERSIEQPMFLNLLLRYVGRSSANPTGWRIDGILRMDEATYLDKRNKFLGTTGTQKTSTQLSSTGALQVN